MLKRERYENFVYRILKKVLSIDPLYTIERQYSKHGCKNKNSLLIDFAVMYDGNLRCYVEAMENEHFAKPNKRSNIYRAIDNEITFILSENDFIKWKCQILHGTPIIYANQCDYDFTDEEGLTGFVSNHISQIENAYLMDTESRETLFLKEYFLKLPADRVNIQKISQPEKFSKELREFVQYYNKGLAYLWIKQNLLSNPQLILSPGGANHDN